MKATLYFVFILFSFFITTSCMEKMAKDHSFFNILGGTISSTTFIIGSLLLDILKFDPQAHDVKSLLCKHTSVAKRISEDLVVFAPRKTAITRDGQFFLINGTCYDATLLAGKLYYSDGQLVTKKRKVIDPLI